MAMASTIGVGSRKYPIILSDALLGKATKEVYSGIRYNHKASDTLCSPSISRQLKPSDEDPARYNLTFSDNPERTKYHGGRTAGEGQYILIFDAAKEHFVLHRLDSNFDMIPIDSSSCQSELKSKLPSTSQKKGARGSSKGTNVNGEMSRRKAEKPKRTKQPARKATPEQDDSDDSLTIEYPGSTSPHNETNNSSTLIYHRQMSESSERDESLIQEEDEVLNQNQDESKLHSPTLNGTADMSEEDMEMALEAELEQELLKESAGHTMVECESDESEEE